MYVKYVEQYYFIIIILLKNTHMFDYVLQTNYDFIAALKNLFKIYIINIYK